MFLRKSHSISQLRPDDNLLMFFRIHWCCLNSFLCYDGIVVITWDAGSNMDGSNPNNTVEDIKEGTPVVVIEMHAVGGPAIESRDRI